MSTEQTVGEVEKQNAGLSEIQPTQVFPAKKKKHGMEFKRNIVFFIMLLPGVVVLIINNYLPMVGVIMPFEDYVYDGKNFFSSLITSKFVGFENFKFMFTSPDVIAATRNTVLYNLVFIALDLLIPVTCAIIMNEMWNRRMSKFYQSVMFLPYFISWIAISYIALAFLNPDNGFINSSLLHLLGMQSVNWYNVPNDWPPIIIFFHLWRYTGYNLIVYVAALSGISDEYYEAASLDGATKLQQVRYITLPMLKTTMVILSLLAVGRIFNGDFDLFYNVPLNIGALYSTTSVIDTYVYNSMQSLGNVSMTAAAGIYQAVVGCVVVLIANFVVRRIDNESALF